jgi:hypothetical protein
MADIQTLVNDIPNAQDGDIIGSDYHNTIKAALQAIAQQMGAGAGPQTVSLTVQPSFLPMAGLPAWNVSLGLATDPGPPAAGGFIPFNLPDGATIQKMVVTGSKNNPASKGFVNLVVIPLGGTSGSTLISIDLTPGGNPFTLTGTPNIPGLTAVALLQIQQVQNTQFKYAILSEVVSPTGTPAASITINVIQIVYTTAS